VSDNKMQHRRTWPCFALVILAWFAGCLAWGVTFP